MSFILTTAERITAQLDKIIRDVCPDCGRRSMYGGIVFELEPGIHASMVCGHFIYKRHVSLEFSKGHLLNDPNGFLHGSGKYRRHLKLTSEADIEALTVREFVLQAFDNQRASSS